MNAKQQTCEAGQIQTIVYANGIYNGYVKERRIFNQGSFYWEDGQFYYGQWLNQEAHGQGIMFFPHGGYLKGNFFHGQIEGFGILDYANEDYYRGSFQNGLFHGIGLKYIKQEGRWVMGQYQRGRLESQISEGTEYPENQLPLQKEDFYFLDPINLKNLQNYQQLELLDTFITPESDLYLGVVRECQPNGLGILIINHGKRLQRGFFKDGYLDLQGREIFISGDVYDGYFTNGKFVGDGVYYNIEDQEWFFGTYSDNKVVNVVEHGRGNYPPSLTDFLPGQNQEDPNLKSINGNLIDFVEEEAIKLIEALHQQSQIYKLKKSSDPKEKVKKKLEYSRDSPQQSREKPVKSNRLYNMMNETQSFGVSTENELLTMGDLSSCQMQYSANQSKSKLIFLDSAKQVPIVSPSDSISINQSKQNSDKKPQKIGKEKLKINLKIFEPLAANQQISPYDIYSDRARLSNSPNYKQNNTEFLNSYRNSESTSRNFSPKTNASYRNLSFLNIIKQKHRSQVIENVQSLELKKRKLEETNKRKNKEPYARMNLMQMKNFNSVPTKSISFNTSQTSENIKNQSNKDYFETSKQSDNYQYQGHATDTSSNNIIFTTKQSFMADQSLILEHRTPTGDQILHKEVQLLQTKETNILQERDANTQYFNQSTQPFTSRQFDSGKNEDKKLESLNQENITLNTRRQTFRDQTSKSPGQKNQLIQNLSHKKHGNLVHLHHRKSISFSNLKKITQQNYQGSKMLQ